MKDIFVIFESPCKVALNTGKFHFNQHISPVTNMIKQAANGFDSVYFTYGVQTPSEDYHEAFIKNLPYLESEIENNTPAIIIGIGSKVYTEMVGGAYSTNATGEVVEISLFDRKYKFISVPAPFVLQNSTTLWKKAAKAIETAVKIAYDVEPEDIGETQFEIVTSFEKIKEIIEYCKRTGYFSFDYETASRSRDYEAFDYHRQEVVATSLSISFQHGGSYVIPLQHFSNELTEEQKNNIIIFANNFDITNLLLIFALRKDVDISINNIYESLLQLLKNDIKEIPEDLISDIYNNIDNCIWTSEQITEIHKLIAEEIMQNKNVIKVGQNIKFDLHWFLRYYPQTIFKGRFEDVMLMSFVHKNIESHGLKEMVDVIYPSFSGYEDEHKKYTWATIPLLIQAKYNAIDTDMTLRLYTRFFNLLLQDERGYMVYRNLFMPLCLELLEIEHEGVKINTDQLKIYIATAQSYIDEIQIELHKHPVVIEFEEVEYEMAKIEQIELLENKIATGKAKNWIAKWTEQVKLLKLGEIQPDYERVSFGTTTNKLRRLFYEKHGFGFPEFYSWKERKYTQSVSKEALDELQDDTGFIEKVKRIVSIKHTVSTFLEGVLNRVDENDYLHTSYRQTIDTGRLSSKNPNLQNIPPEGRHKDKLAGEVLGFVKKVFETDCEEMEYLEVDYSQAELRVIAMKSHETNMIQAYKEGKDLHTLTAAKLSGLTYEEVKAHPDKKSLRQRAKAANFGLIYGLGAAGYKEYARLSYNLLLSDEEATKHRNMFLYEMYPQLPIYHEEMKTRCNKYGGVRTVLGYKRWIPDIYNEDKMKRNHAENAAINTPIQGTAGQLTELAIILLRRMLPKEVRMVNTVHDSIHFVCPKNLREVVIKWCRKIMENLPLERYFINASLRGMPMTVDFSVGETWGTMKEI